MKLLNNTRIKNFFNKSINAIFSLINNVNFLSIIVFFIIAPIFISVNSDFSIKFDIVGKFDPVNRKGLYTTFPISVFITILLIFFIKPFKIKSDLVLLNLLIFLNIFIHLVISDNISSRLLKSSIGLIVLFNFYHIFIKFNQIVFKKMDGDKIINYMAYIWISILMFNYLGILQGDEKIFGMSIIKIYNFFDYYPIILCLISLLFLKKDKKSLLIFVTLSIPSIYILYLTQSRTLQIAYLSVLLISIILFVFDKYHHKTYKTLYLYQKFKIILFISLLISILLFTSNLIEQIRYADDHLKTLAYRSVDLSFFLDQININNILLPHIKDKTMMSLHNQYFELYNWHGIFLLYYLYYFFKIIKKSFIKNPLSTTLVTSYLFIASLMMLPLTHLHTGIVTIYIYSLLSSYAFSKSY